MTGRVVSQRRISLALILAAAGIAAIALAIGVPSSRGAHRVATANGTLTVGIEADVREVDNILASISVDKLIMGSTVYDPLLTSDKNGNALPALALKATPSKNLLTWTFSLRKGVHFTDGKLFTAKDVKENFDAFVDPKNASDFAGDLSNLASTQVVNQNTVAFHLKKPDSRFTSVVQDTMFIADLDARGGSTLLKPGATPIGTGPYKWAGRSPGNSITFVANPGYWRGKPPLQKVVFKVMSNPQIAALAVQNGDVDAVVNDIAPQSIGQLQSNKNLRVLKTTGSTIYQAYFNFEKARKGAYTKPMDVRLGLSYLLDTSRIIPKLIGSFGTLATQPLPPWEPGYNPQIKPIPYNVAKGEQLLAAGGIPKGGTINILVFDRPFTCEWGTAMQAKLKSLGYNATLDCEEPEVAPAKITQYQWDILIARTSGRPTAAVMFDDRWSLAIATPPDDFYTLHDQKLQNIINRMHATVDAKKYAALGRDAETRIMKADVAMVAGYWDNDYIVANKKVSGLVASPLIYVPFLYNGITKVSVKG